MQGEKKFKRKKKKSASRQAQTQEKQPPWFPWWLTAWQYSTTQAEEVEHGEKQAR